MFTQRFPSPIAPLDLEGLVKLIRDPVKADEFWERYKIAKAEYEAARAAAVAKIEEVDKKEAQIDSWIKKLADDSEKLYKEREKFEATYENKMKQLKEWEQKLSLQETALVKDQADVAFRLEQASKIIADANKEADDIRKSWELTLQAVKDENIALSQREQAVTIREQKAEALAKLLREV